MKKKDFLDKIASFKHKVNSLDACIGNDYLPSINYMLSSKLYVDSIFKDLIALFSEASGNNSKILDFGCGSGFLSYIISDHFQNVYGLDTENFNAMVEYSESQSQATFFNQTLGSKSDLWKWIMDAKKNACMGRFDGANIPFSDETFENIMAYAVIEHISDRLLIDVLNELRRVTKIGGKLFIFKLPQKFSITEFFCRIFGMGSHDKLFGRKEIISILSNTGWKVDKIFYSDFVFDFPPSLSNKLYWPLKVLDKIISKTPLKYFGHNLTIFAIKQ